MGDFWSEFNEVYSVESAIDRVLQGRELEGTATTSMRDLTDKGREANSLPLPVPAGTRVRFDANVGSVLTYDDIPGDGVEGTVIKVKSAEGKTTSFDGRVFVNWDDGTFRPIMAEHLRPAPGTNRQASAVAIRVGSLDMVEQMFVQHKRAGDELIHRATKDLWSFRQEPTGGYVIERLFDYKGEPLKV